MTQPDLRPFLVAPKQRGEAAPLLDFMKVAAEQHPGAVVIDRVVGGSEKPTRLVVRATQEAMGALKTRYHGQLLIEADLGLKIPS
jgi:hypothetical protein